MLDAEPTLPAARTNALFVLRQATKRPVASCATHSAKPLLSVRHDISCVLSEENRADVRLPVAVMVEPSVVIVTGSSKTNPAKANDDAAHTPATAANDKNLVFKVFMASSS